MGRIQVGQAHGFVSSFVYRAPSNPLRVYEFPTADEQWLWFVASNRRADLAKEFAPRLDAVLRDADVVVGKIANDATNPVITAFLSGLYGPLSDQSATNTAISLLLPERLKNQYCFLTQRAVDCLEPLEVIRCES